MPFVDPPASRSGQGPLVSVQTTSARYTSFVGSAFSVDGVASGRLVALYELVVRYPSRLQLRPRSPWSAKRRRSGKPRVALLGRGCAGAAAACREAGAGAVQVQRVGRKRRACGNVGARGVRTAHGRSEAVLGEHRALPGRGVADHRHVPTSRGADASLTPIGVIVELVVWAAPLRVTAPLQRRQCAGVVLNASAPRASRLNCVWSGALAAPAMEAVAPRIDAAASNTTAPRLSGLEFSST